MLSTFSDNISTWHSVIDLLEYDILPSLILSCEDDNVYPFVVDFLVYLAKRLEKFEANNFPSNALYATSTLERICHNVARDAITPSKQVSKLIVLLNFPDSVCLWR